MMESIAWIVSYQIDGDSNDNQLHRLHTTFEASYRMYVLLA